MQINLNNNYNKNNTAFGSSVRHYKYNSRFDVSTSTVLFREDLDWKNFSKYLLEHFKDKNSVNILQYASSDGSEAYTQIISLLETGKDVRKFFPIEAIDYDSVIVRAARSGRLNLVDRDYEFLSENTNNFNKYFARTQKQLNIDSDNVTNYGVGVKTYNVSPVLKSRVDFNQGDMFKMVAEIEDKSNTVVLCRNVLTYFSFEEVTSFLTTLSEKLKAGSIFVMGNVDRYTHENKINELLKKFDFEEVMNNVYTKLNK